MKTTSNERQPQNLKSGIAQQLFLDYTQILNLNLDDQTKWKHLPMENNIKIIELEYLCIVTYEFLGGN